MKQSYDFNFDFEKRPYLFAFRPEVDDFSVVRIEKEVDDGGTWELVEKRPFVDGHCLECAGNGKSKTSAWVFSRGFHFEKGRRYEAVIYYRGGGSELLSPPRELPGLDGTRQLNNARFALWLCREQAVEAKVTKLIEVGVAHQDYQYMSVVFEVDHDGTYFFGGNAKIRPGSDAAVALGLNLAGLPGSLNSFV